MIIRHNIAGLKTLNRATSNQRLADKSLEKISSGLRINKAADDSAGLSISEKMKSQIRGLEQAQRNIQDGISLIQTAEGGLGEIINPNLQRLRELAVQAANDTLSSTERQMIQKEINQVKQSINEIAYNTHLNDVKPLVPLGNQNSAPVSPSKQKVDIVFLVDYSSSMGYTDSPTTRLGAVMGGIEGFVSELSNTMDAKVGIVNITNSTPSYAALSDSPEVIKQNLKNVSNWDSGTRPYQNIEQSIPTGEIGRNLEYREDSKKIFVLFTDAEDEVGSYTSDDYYPYNESRAMNAVEGSTLSSGFDEDDIQTYVFAFGQNYYSGISESDVDSIVQTTGGKYYSTGISTAEEIENKLKNDLVTDINTTIQQPSEDVNLPRKVTIQIGANEGETFEMELTDARTTALGIEDIKVDPWEEASKAIEKLDQAIKKATTERSRFGAYESVLESINNNVLHFSENLIAAESRIRDVDMAKELIQYTKQSILTQTTEAMFAQANQQSKSILELLK